MFEVRKMNDKKRFVISLEVKKAIFVTAKNKTEARKKAAKKLSTQKGANFVKINYVEEHFTSMWM